MSGSRTGPVSHPFLLLLVLIAHTAMLVLVMMSFGINVEVFKLACIVLMFDFIGAIALQFVAQEACTVDTVLMLVLGMSTIYQSCFGGRNDFFLTGTRGIWIDLGFITIQPSEFVKPVFVLICASSIRTQLRKKELWGIHFVPDNLMLLFCTALIAGLQWYSRDLGSLPTFAAAAGCALLLRFSYLREKISVRLMLCMGVGVVFVCIMAWKLAPSYVQDRLHVDIWSDMSGSGYQQVKALTAIAEGGWFGKGAGNGTLVSVAASRTDIIFSTICEEWGLFTAIMTVVLVLFLPASILTVPPRSYYHSGLAICVSAMFVMQMTLNIFGSCNLIPFTGVTIPFISQGGSSMLASGIMAGFLKAAQAPVLTGRSAAQLQRGGGR